MEQIVRICEAYDLKSEQLEMQENWGVEQLTQDICHGYQFWPHRLDGEGFFISILKDKRSTDHEAACLRGKIKAADFQYLTEVDLSGMTVVNYDTHFFAFVEEEYFAVDLLKEVSTIIKKGLYLGELKGRDFIPSYDLAMNKRALASSKRTELTEDQPFTYLSGNALQVTDDKGVMLLTYKGVGLGWGKSIGQRINNLYPRHLRISKF